VIITRFSPKPAPTHGHHTASAVLAVEAFRLAADPTAFPEQLGALSPWQARRIVHNVGLGAAAANPGAGMAIAGSPANVPDGPGVVKVEVGGRDPVSGESFASIAARSRGMHKTQGFGIGGPPVNEGSRIEPFVLLAGDGATDHPGLPRPRGRHRGGSRRGRARRDREAAPYGHRALAHPRALDGGALPERSPRDQQGHRAAREPAGRSRNLPGRAGEHAAEPAV